MATFCYVVFMGSSAFSGRAKEIHFSLLLTIDNRLKIV